MFYHVKYFFFIIFLQICYGCTDRSAEIRKDLELTMQFFLYKPKTQGKDHILLPHSFSMMYDEILDTYVNYIKNKRLAVWLIEYNLNLEDHHLLEYAEAWNEKDPDIAICFMKYAIPGKTIGKTDNIFSKFTVQLFAPKVIPFAAGILTKFLINLKKRKAIVSNEDVRLIGFSLGATVITETAEYFAIPHRSLGSEHRKIGKLTLLNPVGEPFLANHHVSRNIALKVQLLITSGAVGMIFKKDRAHETIIVNEDSSMQPICPVRKIKIFYYLDCCCHLMAHDMFVLSLREPFIAATKVQANGISTTIYFGITNLRDKTMSTDVSSHSSYNYKDENSLSDSDRPKFMQPENVMYYISLNKVQAERIIQRNLSAEHPLHVKSFLMENISLEKPINR